MTHSKHQPEIVVVGVGNTLMQDDGIGVRVVRMLCERYELPQQVQVIDGGVAGYGWLPQIDGARRLVIVDAAAGNGPPGTVYRLTADELVSRTGPTLSAHEIGVAEILSLSDLLGTRPETLILGIQTVETRNPGLELTPALNEALPAIVDTLATELCRLGAEVALNPARTANRT